MKTLACLANEMKAVLSEYASPPNNGSYSYLYQYIIASYIATHWPNTSLKGHWIRNPRGNTGWAKVKGIVTNFTSYIWSQRTVATVTITRCACCPKTEGKLVITLAISTPPRVAAASPVYLAAVSSSVFVAIVSVVTSSDIKPVATSDQRDLCS